MQNFLTNNRIGALMTILVLGIGSISVVETTHVTTASQIGKLCVFFACGNATINSGGGGGGQPTPNTATLTVFKKVHCVAGKVCPDAKDFTIKVSGTPASPSSFPGSETGTTVTLIPGTYTVSEEPPAGFTFTTSFTGACINASISAGETKT